MSRTLLVWSAGSLVLFASAGLRAEPPRKGVDVQVNPPARQAPGIDIDVNKGRPGDARPGVRVEVNRPGAVRREGAATVDRTLAARAMMLKASQALGATVRNPAGDNVGELQDLVIEDRSGQVRYAVLGVGGFLGVGEKYFALPWGALRISTDKQDTDDKYFVADLDKDRLKNAPGFDKSHWPDFTDPRTTGAIDKHYGASAAGLSQGTVTKASELKGAKIHDQANADVGDVNDFVLDVNQGKVRYLALGIGGFLGIGEKLIPVPWSAATIKHPTDDLTKAYITLATDETRLKRAPGFDKNEWPSFAEPFWSQEVDRYHGPAQQEATRGTSRR